MAAPIRDALISLAGELEKSAATARQLADDHGSGAAEDEESSSPLDVIAERLLRQRHARTGFFPPSLFHEPAWEILLSLFVNQRRGRTLNVKHLVEAVDAPVTTSQRWIDTLAHMKLVQRSSDANDRRRIELSLSESTMQAMERYLTWLSGDGRPARDAADGTAPDDPAG